MTLAGVRTSARTARPGLPSNAGGAVGGRNSGTRWIACSPRNISALGAAARGCRARAVPVAGSRATQRERPYARAAAAGDALPAGFGQLCGPGQVLLQDRASSAGRPVGAVIVLAGLRPAVGGLPARRSSPPAILRQREVAFDLGASPIAQQSVAIELVVITRPRSIARPPCMHAIAPRTPRLHLPLGGVQRVDQVAAVHHATTTFDPQPAVAAHVDRSRRRCRTRAVPDHRDVHARLRGSRVVKSRHSFRLWRSTRLRLEAAVLSRHSSDPSCHERELVGELLGDERGLVDARRAMRSVGKR